MDFSQLLFHYTVGWPSPTVPSDERLLAYLGISLGVLFH